MVPKRHKQAVMALLDEYLAESRFCCGQKLENLEPKFQPLEKYEFFVDHRETCNEPISGWYFDSNHSESLCGFCMGDLCEDTKKLFEEERKLYNAVVPNCGRKLCLEKNPTGVSGFIRGTKKLGKNKKQIQNSKSVINDLKMKKVKQGLKRKLSEKPKKVKKRKRVKKRVRAKQLKKRKSDANSKAPKKRKVISKPKI